MLIFMGYSALFAIFDNRILMLVWRVKVQRAIPEFTEQ